MSALTEMRAVLQEWSSFFVAKSYLLRQFPTLLFQEAANQPDSSPPAAMAWARKKKGFEKRPWLQHMNKAKARSACLMTIGDHDDQSISGCAFSRDGHRILARFGGSWKVADADTGAEIFVDRQPAGASRRFLRLSPDGRRALSVSGDNTLKVIDAARGAELITLEVLKSTIRACAFSPDSGRIAVASGDGAFKLWDAEKGAELGVLKGHAKSVGACAFSPDGRRIVSASADRTLKIWDADRQIELATMRPVDNYTYIRACAFSPDGQRVVSVSGDGILKLWDAGSGTELAALKGHPRQHILDLAFSPDGRSLVSAADDHTLKLWDTETGAELATLEGHEEAVAGCAFSPDGNRIVSASSDRTLKIWDAVTGAELATLKGHAGDVTACTFSPDGLLIASASADRTLRLWDAHTGAELACLRGHTGDVYTCAFSMDGKLIRSGSKNEVIIWDAQERVEISRYVLSGHTVDASSQDGLLIAALTINGEVLILKLDNVISGPPLATAWRHTEFAFGCPLCRSWSEIPESALGTEISCPACGARIKVNAFTITGDWRPIAAAWGRDSEESRRAGSAVHHREE